MRKALNVEIQLGLGHQCLSLMPLVSAFVGIARWLLPPLFCSRRVTSATGATCGGHRANGGQASA